MTPPTPPAGGPPRRTLGFAFGAPEPSSSAQNPRFSFGEPPNLATAVPSAVSSSPTTSSTTFNTQTTFNSVLAPVAFALTAPSTPTPSLFATPSRSSVASTSPAAGTSPGERGRSLFGNTSAPQTTQGLFGRAAGSTNASPVLNPPTTQNNPGSLFGGPTTANASTGGLFGSQASGQPTTSSGLFARSSSPSQTTGHPSPSTGGLFGRPAGETTGQPTTSSDLFNRAATEQPATSTGGLFGRPAAEQPGSSTGGLFGSQTTTHPLLSGGGGIFGAALIGSQTTSNPPPSGGGLFGSQTTSNPPPSGGGLFGSQTTRNPPPSGGGLFGSQTTRNPPPSGGGLFGRPAGETTGQPTTSSGLFSSQATGQSPASTGGLFGRPATQQPATSTGNLFGSQTTEQPQPPTSTGGLFGRSATGQPPTSTGGLFGRPAAEQPATSTGGLFGSHARQSTASTSGLFGRQATGQGGQTTGQPSTSTGSLFGGSATQPSTSTGSLFSGSPPQPATSTRSLFSGSPPQPATSTGSLFSGSATQPTTSTRSLFSGSPPQPTTSTGSLFSGSATQPTTSTGLFGSTTGQTRTTGGSLFGRPVATQPAVSTGGLLGGQTTRQPQNSTGLFGGQSTGQPTTSSGGLFRNRTTGHAASFSFGAAASPTQDGLSTTPAAGNLANSTGSAGLSTNTSQASGSLFGASPVAPVSNPSLSGQMRSLSINSDVQPSGPASMNTGALGASDGKASIPYNIADEEPQVHEFFSSSVTTAIREAEKIAGDLRAAINETKAEVPEDSDLNLLGARAWVKMGQNVRKRTIAVLGDSGQGKSSLINSLLHVPGIAHTSDTGSACTSVVTEYHQKGAFQTSPIAINVHYYSGAALEDLVKELAWSYRQLYLPDAQRSELISDQDYAKYQKESDEAWSALQAAFQHQEGFSPDFLRDVSDGAADRINLQLIQWAHGIKWPSGGYKTSLGHVDSLYYTANNAEECCETTRAFMEDGLWPFTKIIRVYLSCSILNGGVILADLPGLHDTNLARVKATQDYLLKCDRLLIVSKIARAITDQSVRSTLFSVVARHMPMEWKESGGKKLRLAVVCTEAERINIKTAMTEFCGEGKRISSEDMERLEADTQAAKASGDNKAKKGAKRRLEFALITARAAHVTDALQKRYSDETGGHLDVFCVGNQAYEKFCRKGNTEFVKASGIPKLRQFCITITADDRLLDARNVIRSEIPSLLNSADLWTSSNMPHGAFDQLDKSNMLQHLENIRSQVPEYITRLREAFVDCFKEQIMGLWMPQEHKWRSTAIEATKEWEKWRWNSYNTWCRHNGKHSTSTHENVDWNSQIIWKMRMELAFQWDILEEEVPTLFKKLMEDLSKELTWLKDDTILQASATPHRDLLIDSVDAIDQLWKYNVELEGQKLARGLAHIRKQASESNETSYILGEMLGTYRTASTHSGALFSARANSSGTAEEEIGKGIFELQKADVGGHIRGETLFSNIAIRMSNDVDALGRRTEESVGILVKQVMERLDYDIKMALKEGELATGAENSVTELKKVVDRLKDRLEELPKF